MPFFITCVSCNGKIVFFNLQKTGTFMWPIRTLGKGKDKESAFVGVSSIDRKVISF